MLWHLFGFAQLCACALIAPCHGKIPDQVLTPVLPRPFDLFLLGSQPHWGTKEWASGWADHEAQRVLTQEVTSLSRPYQDVIPALKSCLHPVATWMGFQTKQQASSYITLCLSPTPDWACEQMFQTPVPGMPCDDSFAVSCVLPFCSPFEVHHHQHLIVSSIYHVLFHPSFRWVMSLLCLLSKLSSICALLNHI